jgi:alpha-galactosidase
MPEVTIVGVGSTIFAYEVVTADPLTSGRGLGTPALVDIDVERLELARRIAGHPSDWMRR